MLESHMSRYVNIHVKTICLSAIPTSYTPNKEGVKQNGNSLCVRGKKKVSLHLWPS